MGVVWFKGVFKRILIVFLGPADGFYRVCGAVYPDLIGILDFRALGLKAQGCGYWVRAFMGFGSGFWV